MAASKIDKVCKLLDPDDIIGKIAPCFKTLLFDSQSFVRGIFSLKYIKTNLYNITKMTDITLFVFYQIFKIIFKNV